MNDRKWTFLFVRDGEAPIQQFSMLPQRAKLIGGIAGLCMLSVLVTVAFVTVSGFQYLRTGHLERENATLTGELDRFREQVSDFESTLASLAQENSEFRVLAGLDALDQEVLQVGIGGPRLTGPESGPLWDMDPDLGTTVYALDFDLSALERRARLLSESMHEATDSLLAHHDLLESTPSILPTRGYLSSGFTSARAHPIHNEDLPHEGVDITAPEGTPILAAAKGRVIFAGRKTGYGLMVEIDHGYGYVTRYGHASELVARRGQEVQRGDVVAKVGRTGIATGPHLHYEVLLGGRPMNPLNFIITQAIP